MNHTFTKLLNILLLMMIALFTGFSAMAQYTLAQQVAGERYVALTKDKQGHIYTTRLNASNQYEVVRYENSNTGSPTVICTGLSYSASAISYPFGLAVNTAGDVYVTNPLSAVNWRILKIPGGATATTAVTPITMQEGRFFCALAFDVNDNLLSTEYDQPSDQFRIVRYTKNSENQPGTPVWSGFPVPHISGVINSSFPWGLTVDGNNNIYATDYLEPGGRLIKLTAPAYSLTTLSTGRQFVALTVDAANSLYATELTSASAARIVKFTTSQLTGTVPTGEILNSGIAVNGFLRPWGLTINTKGDIYTTHFPSTLDGVIMKLIPPTVSVTITRAAAALTNTPTVAYTVTFSGYTPGVTTAAFSLSTPGLTGASISSITTTDNITYTVTINTGTGDGTAQLTLNGTGITNTISTPLPLSGAAYTIDKTLPTGSFNINNNAVYTTSTGVTLNSITGSDANGPLTMRYSVDGGSTWIPSAFEALAATKTGVTLPAGDGLKTVKLQIKDGAGNIADFQDQITLDQTPPTLSFNTRPANPSNSTNATFSFNVEAGATLNATLDGVGPSPIASPITFTGLSETSHTISVTATDAAGNTSSPITYTWLIDTQPPAFVSLTSPANGYYRATQSLDFTVKYSENVTVVGTPYIEVNIGGNVRQANYVSGSASTSLLFRYTIVDGDNDMDGIGINSDITLPAGSSIKDQVGNNAPTTLGTAPDLSQVRVDTKPPIPTITATATFPVTAPFTITVTFDEDIADALTAADFTSLGVTVKNVVQVDAHTWTALLQPPPNQQNGSSSVTLIANQVHDATGNGNMASIAYPFTWDTRIPAPTVTPPANKYYKAGDVITFTITYDENVVITGAPTLPIIIDGTTHNVPMASNTANSLTFSYTVATGEQDLDGIDLGAQIALNGGSIKDAAGNDAAIGVANHYAGILVDGRAPTVTSVIMPPPGSHNGYYINELGTPLVFTINTSETVSVSGTPTLDVNIGGVTRQALFASNIGSQLIFTYNIVDGDNDEDGITIGAQLNFPGGSYIRDAAGNNIDPTLNGVGDGSGIKINTTHPGVTITPVTPSPYNGPFDIIIGFTEQVTDDLLASGFDLVGGIIGNLSTSDHKTWTATFTPNVNAEGAGHIQVRANVVHNTATNGNNASAVYNFNYDTKGPAIVSLPNLTNGTYKEGDVISFTFTFDEPLVITGSPILPVIIGATTHNVPVTSNTAGALNFSYTIAAGEEDLDGIAQSAIDLNGGTIKDALGNNAVLPTAFNNFPLVLVDARPPVISSVTVPASGYHTTTTNPVLTFTVHTSENVVVTGSPVLHVNIGGVDKEFGLTGGSGTSALTFSYTVVDGDNDMDGITVNDNTALDLKGGTIKDAAGNDMVLTLVGKPSTAGVFVNTVIPSVVLSSTGPGGLLNAPFTVTATFSEPVTGFTATGLTLVNANAGTPTTTNNISYDILITPIVDGPVSVKVKAGAAINTGTNPNQESNQLDRFYDTNPPDVTSVTIPAGVYKAGDDVFFTANANEILIVGGTPLIPFTLGATAANAAYLDNDGTPAPRFKYTVQPGDLDLDGITLGANLNLNGGTIRDVATNDVTLPIGGALTFPTVIIDGVAPTVTSLDVPLNGYYNAGTTLDFRVHTSESVTISGSPVLHINIGGVDREANLLSGNGSNVLVFSYTVVTGDNDADGITLDNNTALDLKGGVITDGAGNPAVLTLNSVPSTAGVRVNTNTPSVTLTTTAPDPVNGRFTVTATFSEGVTVFTLTDISVTNAAGLGSLNGSPDNTTYTFEVIPTTDGNIDVTVPANGVVNNAGTVNTASNTLSRNYDGTKPTIASVDLPATGTYKAGDVLNVTVHYSENVNVVGNPTLDLIMTSGTAQLTYTGGSGTQDLGFIYTVVNPNDDQDGISLGTDLQLPVGATIKDVAGNDAVLTLSGISANVVKIDAVPPVVTSVNVPANGFYKEGDVLSFKVNTSENVDITGTPTIDVNIGGVVKQLAFTGGSGTKALSFSYTVQPGDNDLDGIVLVNTIALTGGSTAKDAAGNDLTLALNSVASTSGVKIKTIHPGVTITPATPSPYNNAFNITIEFTDVVTDDLLAASFDFSGGAVSDIQTSDHKTWTAIFRPFVNSEAAGHVQVKADVVHDIAGNGNAASNIYNFTYDTKPPSIVSWPHPADGTYRAGDVLSFTFTFDEALVITGSPVLPVIIGANTRNVPLASNTAGVLTFNYTIVAGEEDLDGIDMAVIDPNGGTITDALNNNARLSTGSTNFPLVLVDAVPPVVTSVAVPANGFYKAGDVLSFTVHTSENVDITGTPTIDVNIGGVVKQLALTGGAGTNALTFEYTVQPGDNDMDGIMLVNTIALTGGSTAKDAAGNDLTLALNNVASTSGVFVNTVIPSVTLSTTAPAIVNAPFTITATFSEKVTGFADGDMNVTNGTVSDLATTDGGITYTMKITPTGSPVNMTVPAGAAVNIGDNPNTASNTLTVDYDATAPTITSVDLPATGTYRSGDVLNFDVNFGENVQVTGTPALDIIMNSGTATATYLGGSGTNTLTFSYTVLQGDLDADGITLGANLQPGGGTIKDAAGNDALLALHNISTNVVTIDATAPVIASVGVPLPGYYKNGNDLFFTVYFNENITVTGSPVLEVQIGSATREATVQATGANSLTFRYNIQPGDQDLDGIELATALKLNGATIKDGIGNDALLDLHNVGVTARVYVYSVVPAVTFSGIVTNAPFTLSVIFSEKVTGFDITDVQVTNATLTGFATTDNITYTMTLTPVAQGTVTLKVPANAAVNVAGTGNAASSNISYYYDGTPPVITSVDVPADKYYKAGDVLSFTVHYSETVNVMASTPQELQLPLILDGKTVYADFVSGGGANGDLLFSYTVADGDMDLNGINLGASLRLNSGWIRDASANNAVLTLNGVPNTSQVRINTAKPSVQIASAAGPRVNAPFMATITFSELVTGFTAAGITAVNATVSAPLTSDGIVYTIMVTPGTDGVLNISIPANVAVNNAGNNNTASNSLGRTVDKTAPVINVQTLSVNNNAPVGTAVGTLTATDASNNFQDWTITSDPTGGAFVIDNAGKITVKDATLLDSRAGATVTLGVTVSDGLNTSSAANIPVNVILAFVNKTPTLDAISNVSICTGTDVHTIQLTGASAVEAGQTYTITATSNQPYFDQLSVSAAGVLSYQLKNSVTTGTATITVTIKDDGGTANGAVDQLSRTFTITVNNLPAITISSDKGNSVSKGDVIHLTATGASTYSWTDMDGIISGQHTATLEAKAKDNATYEVTATSASGCIGIASISITVIEDFKVDATNILTPNGDGRNDKWVIRNLDSYPNNEVQVYDRAGRIVFQQRNYANDWLGTLNGKPLAEGTYYYILRINDGAKTAKGYITIIRDEQ